MSDVSSANGLAEGTTVEGWIRTESDGRQYVPCGCGQAVQRPAPERLDAVQAEYDAVSVEVTRVFVCEDDECDERTVQTAASSSMEANR